MKGKSLLIFSRKDEQTEKRSQGNAVGPEALRLLSSQGFHLGRVLIHRAVMQPPGLLAPDALELQEACPPGPSQGWGDAGALYQQCPDSPGRKETQERVI